MIVNKKTSFFVGPMSKNVVDAVLEYNSEKKDFQIGFIPSRRQVDYCNGYVNNWTTETFAQYVKLNNNSTIVQRDHGGPGQGFFKDDGKESFESDARWFDIIHIDPWKEYPNYEKASTCLFLQGFVYETQENDKENAQIFYEEIRKGKNFRGHKSQHT